MSHLKPGFSRRSFVRATAASVALTAASYRRVLGANERVGVGFIGFGLIGKRHVLDFRAQPDAACVAMCDCHQGRLAEGQSLAGESCRAYADFRKLLDDPAVHAVVISTPDHWHALMTMLACAAGKDVYVEKPLSLFVREGRWMCQVANRTRRVVQVGTQQRSGAHYQRARELVRAGHIGRVHSVRMQAFRNIMPGFGSPPDGQPPRELDWNMFLGPAPARPYNPNRGIYHFRWFWDYSGGQMTNLGHHSLDIVRWFLDADPLVVSSLGGRFCLEDNGETPDTQDALFAFPAAKGMAATEGSEPLRLMAREKIAWTAVWSHREASAGPQRSSSLEFCGTKGTLAISRRGFTILADEQVPPENRVPRFAGAHPVGGPQRGAAATAPKPWTQSLEDASGDEREQFIGHVRNFLDCVKTRTLPISDLESAHRVSTMCHLANLSLRLGRQLRWNAANEQILDDAEANEQLTRPYRPPWDAELRALGVT